MGCDFSGLAKQQFLTHINELKATEKKIYTKKVSIEQIMTEFNEIVVPEINLNSISLKLLQNIEILENISKEIQKLKRSSTNDTFKTNNSLKFIAESQKPYEQLICTPSEKLKDAPQDEKVTRNNTKIHTNVNTNKNTISDTILNDPEIAALINKNRKKLQKKLTN